MTLLLTRLDIHGFKSFANPTTFIFDHGITAVIGPNGSGKSNVAEALRWVLGEQGHANLRSRRTEDVIFSGSERRPALGMAEVTVTFDNRDGDLPLEFSEVTVGRRAFRSGENQYLINGARVRLKDVQQLVAPLGQAYTIIGQGLVDAALSQRPEERRGLFEHAAGIGGLRLRATDAERSLAESAGNVERLRDILGELEPRVRSLERSARLAREYGAVRDRLRELQQRHYAQLWRASAERVSAARGELRTADTALLAEEERHQSTSRRLAELRGEQARLTTEAARLREIIATTERELAGERHRRDLLDARTRAATERLHDQHRAHTDALRLRDEALSEATLLEADLATLAARIATTTQQLADAEASGRAALATRDALTRELSQLERDLLDTTRERAAAAGALAALGDRLQSIEHEREDIAAGATRDRALLAAGQVALAEVDERRTALDTTLQAIEQDVATSSANLTDMRLDLEHRAASIANQERELAATQARLDLLERTHLAGEGLYAGVRAVVRAVRQGQLALPGLLGPLAELIDVPARLETAIEIALGGHMQDIVVERWHDAEAGIEFLKQRRAGRATFQPLDTVRAGSRPASPPATAGVIGVAADLAGYDPRIGAVIANTLGRTLIVTDLETSRQMLSAAPGWTIVTLAGEIARPGGSVTGGSRSAEAGMLARERERRALPAMIERATQQLAEERSAWETARTAAAQLARDLAETTASLETQRQAARTVAGEQERQRHELERAEAAVARHTAREAEIGTRYQAIVAEQAQRATDVLRIDAALEAAQARRSDLSAQLAALPPLDTSTVAMLKAELTGLRERATSATTAAQQARSRAEGAERNATERATEAGRLQAVIEAGAAERASLEHELVLRATQLEQDHAALPPVEAARTGLANDVTQGERTLDHATVRLREAERERDRASLGLARAQDEQVFLAERVRSDLGLDDPEELTGSHDDEPGNTDEANETEIQRLRERLRRMAVVGEDVLEQYEAESNRLTFLTTQLSDVEEAAEGIRTVLAEVHARMRERFDTTFRDVGTAFERTFTRLFGGGTARLALHAGDDGTTSIDIIAQPPGKRLSGLSALSGGERALTAVALLIAIQRVNPSPFCLLDEVDAALDESNVLRFRDEIRDLAGTTQFIVITHNRGTIEGADVLYGVTMGEDSISRVLSLRLEEAVRQVEERELSRAAAG